MVKKIWFRRREGLLSKDFGWGYIPITKEGWITLIIFCAWLIGSIFYTGVLNGSGNSVFWFVINIAVIFILFVTLAEIKTKKTSKKKKK